jgi:hypothetical protein
LGTITWIYQQALRKMRKKLKGWFKWKWMNSEVS